jgi:plasmid stabilization system protein ParE
MKVRFTATSFAEINEIHDHIAKDNPTAAKAVILRVEQVIARIARFPLIARAFRQACASFPWGRFLILSSILLRPMR